MKLKYKSDIGTLEIRLQKGTEIWTVRGAHFRMYPPNVTAQHLGRMDLIYKNDTGNKNLKHSQAEEIYRQRNILPHQGYFFFPESIMSAASG